VLSVFLPPLVDAARADVGSPAAQALLGLAARRSEVAVALFDMLETLPVAKVKGNFVLSIATGFKGDARAVALLGRWAETGSNDVKRQATRGLEQR
jgi:hypothetical protein